MHLYPFVSPITQRLTWNVNMWLPHVWQKYSICKPRRGKGEKGEKSVLSGKEPENGK
jgi:hypothetical protein